VNSLILRKPKPVLNRKHHHNQRRTIQSIYGKNEPDRSGHKRGSPLQEALWESFTVLKERPVLSTNLSENIVQTINRQSIGIRRVPGTTISNLATGKILYTPPGDETIIRDKLKNS